MKGQAEAIGISVIIAILAISVLVFFVFSEDNTEDPRREAGLMMLDYFGHTLLQSDINYATNCRKSVYTLIDDIYSRGAIDLGCGEPSGTAENVLIDYITKIADETLDKQGYNAKIIVIQADGTQVPVWHSSSCSQNRFGVKRYPLALSNQLEITIC